MKNKEVVKAWIEAFRLRTLPLALACIGMGSFLAGWQHAFDGLTLSLCLITTLFLQTISNLANDYGDAIHGADHEGRQGPIRGLQSGLISKAAYKRAIIIFVVLALISGLSLIFYSLELNMQTLLFFLGLGVAAIIAAITYTAGKKPYGYIGLGDLFVFLFFGIVGVCGSYYLFTATFSWTILLPAYACGVFAVGVLNVNNIRDIPSDIAAGKRSMPVRMGRRYAVRYHGFLLGSGMVAAIIFYSLTHQIWYHWFFILTVPLFVYNVLGVGKHEDPAKLDPYLKQMAISTLLFVLSFGIGILF